MKQQNPTVLNLKRNRRHQRTIFLTIDNILLLESCIQRAPQRCIMGWGGDSLSDSRGPLVWDWKKESPDCWGLRMFLTCHLAAAVTHHGDGNHTLEEFSQTVLSSKLCLAGMREYFTWGEPVVCMNLPANKEEAC